MERLTFSTTIAAPADRVWRILLEDATYRQWTSVFAEGSYAETDWQEGSEARFLAPGGDGLLSRIVTHRPNEFLELEHLGMLKDGVLEQTAADGGWASARESYTLTPGPQIITLTVRMDTLPSHRECFEKTWPQALSKVKALSEAA